VVAGRRYSCRHTGSLFPRTNDPLFICKKDTAGEGYTVQVIVRQTGIILAVFIELNLNQ
jgi:hypothetical protein